MRSVYYAEFAADIRKSIDSRVEVLACQPCRHSRTVVTALASRLRVEGDTTIVSQGLNPGDLVVSTRLADPLENTLLEITNPDAGGGSS